MAVRNDAACFVRVDLQRIDADGLHRDITAAMAISEIGDFSRFLTSQEIARRMLVWMWHMVKTNQPHNRRDTVTA